MIYPIVKVVHIIALFSWIGGLLTLASFIKFILNQPKENQLVLTNYARKIYLYSNLPGLILTLITGLYMMMPFMKNGWMHTKLLFVVFMFVLDHVLMRKLKKMSKNDHNFKAESFKFFHIIISIVLIVIVYLVVVKPF
jgi:putative membrane protein